MMNMGKLGLARKMTAILILVAVVPVLISSLLMLALTRQQFSDYVDRNNQVLVAQWTPLIEDYYQQYRGFGGLQDFMEAVDALTQIRRYQRGQVIQPGLGQGRRLVVANTSGIVVADSEGLLIGQPANFGNLHVTARTLTSDNQKVGTLYVISPLGLGLASLEEDFINGLTSNTVILVFIVGILALVAGWLLGKRLTSPLAELSTGIHQLAKGNLKVRVIPSGDQEFVKLGSDFNLMAQRLEETEKTRRRLTADIAHELRTPLALLRGQLEGMQSGRLPTDPESVVSLLDEVIRLSRLVKDLENLSLVESHALKLNITTFPVSELLEHLNPVNIAMQDREIEFTTEIAPVVKEIKADQSRLVQILLNLLSNAMQHTGARGKVTFSIGKEMNNLRFAVKDSGPGIPAEDLPHVFDRFYRVDDSRNRDEGGMGLGLSIAKGYVEAHGGTIWVESTMGEGSTFYFTLPQ